MQPFDSEKEGFFQKQQQPSLEEFLKEHLAAYGYSDEVEQQFAKKNPRLKPVEIDPLDVEPPIDDVPAREAAARIAYKNGDKKERTPAAIQSGCVNIMPGILRLDSERTLPRYSGPRQNRTGLGASPAELRICEWRR